MDSLREEIRSMFMASLWSKFALQKNEAGKQFYRRGKSENSSRIVLLRRTEGGKTQRPYICLSAKYFSVYYCISGKHPDPSCSSQGDFTQ